MIDAESLKKRIAQGDASFQHALNEIISGPKLSDQQTLDLLKAMLQVNVKDQETLGQTIGLIQQWLETSEGPSHLDLTEILVQDSHTFYKTTLLPTHKHFVKLVADKKIGDCIVDFASLRKSLIVQEHLKKQGFVENIESLVNSCIAYSESINPATVDQSFRRAHQKDLTSFCDLLVKVAGPDYLKKAAIVQLNLALGFLMLPVLEKKIAGATLILMFVLKNKDKDYTTLIEWCDKVQIFDVFFNKSLHPEIVNKSPWLLAFLHRQGRFGEAELEKMWHIATKKHDAFRRSVIDVLKFLVDQCLNWQQIDNLVQKIKALSGKEQETKSLELLKQIAKKLSSIQTVVAAPPLESGQEVTRKKPTRSLSEEQKTQRKVDPIEHTKRTVGNIRTANYFGNPFEVPAEKQDKNTADDEMSPKTGGQHSSFDKTGQLQQIVELSNQKVQIEEAKSSHDNQPSVPSKYYNSCDIGIEDQQRRRIALEVIQMMWQFCLDDCFYNVPAVNLAATQRGLSVVYHMFCIDQFTEVINRNYMGAWFFFLREAVDKLKKNKFAITMQLVITKLLVGIQFPILDSYESDRKQNLPNNKADLCQALECDLKLTQACLSSYIDFKRESLQLIHSQNFEQNQDDNLETQSSLDGDEVATPTPTQPVAIQPVLILEESKEETKNDTRARNSDRSFLDSMVTNKLYGYSFNKEMLERMNFLRVFIIQCPEHLLNPSQLQVLWEVLVNNAFYEKERNLFFTWITDILKEAQKRQNSFLLKSNYGECQDIFSDDCLELLFFETLLKLDTRAFTLEMFTCFQQFFLHINQQYGQVETGMYDVVRVHEPHKLIGIETLWEITLSVADEGVYKKSLEFFNAIFRKSGAITQEIKQYVLQTCVASVRQGQDEEEGTTRISRSIKVLSNFIDEFEGDKSKYKGLESIDNTSIQLSISNQVSGSQGPKSFELNLPQSTTIGAVKNQLATTMFPKRVSSDLTILYKGKDLNQELKTLKEVVGSNAKPVTMMIAAKSKTELEYENSIKMEESIDEQTVREAIETLKEFLGGCPEGLNDEIIGLALRKCKLDIGEAINMVTQEDMLLDLRLQLVVKNLKPMTEQMNISEVQQEDDYSLNQIISNDKQYFNLLFDLLNLGQQDVTTSVWNLLMQIPVNKELHNAIKSLDQIHTISASEHVGWSQLIYPHTTYKMLYSLQLLNTMINTSSKKAGDIAEQVRWRERFLSLGGVNHLYEVLITADIEEMMATQAQPHKKKKGSRKRQKLVQEQVPQRNDQARCLALLIGIVKIFLQAALLSFDSNASLYQLIIQSNPRPTSKPKQEANDSSSVDKSSQNTPKFGDEVPATSKASKQSLTQVYDFETLIAQMKPIASTLIFQTVNVAEMIRKLLHIVYFVVGNQLSTDHAELIQHSLDLILPFLIFQPEHVATVINFEHIQLILLRTLQASDDSVRGSAERLFGNLIKSNTEMRQFILKTLLASLVSKQPVTSTEFFNLACLACRQSSQEFKTCEYEFTEIGLDDLHSGQFFNANYLLRCLVQLIRDRPIVESKSNKEEPDLTISGYLGLIKELVEICPGLKSICRQQYHLVTIIYDYLFKLPQRQSKYQADMDFPKLKSKLSRKKAFTLLISLCKDNIENFEILLAKIQKFTTDISGALANSDVDEYLGKQQLAKSANGYVGLKNFGCTCYMNSLIQQLYMIGDFSQALIEMDVDPKQEVVVELQKIFANLQASEKQAYAPKGFTQVFKLDGQHINVREQQDAHEFLNKLLENIEDASPKLKELIQQCLAGSLCNETKSLDPEFPYSSYTTEPFYCLTLDIQNKKTLQEALDMYVKPDILDGDNKWFCEPHNTKVDAQKRTLIQDLKDTVCVGLKRFKFDFQKMERIKINDHFEFPETIDFKPWTKAGVVQEEFQEVKLIQPEIVSQGNFSDNEAISSEEGDKAKQVDEILSDQGFEDFIGCNQDDDNSRPQQRQQPQNQQSSTQLETQYLYQLVGVLVHSGSANSGHYYSYIKERQSEGNWYEFNDTLVKDFNIKQLADKCFGNKLSEEKKAQQDLMFAESHANAYLLFYQRIKKTPTPLVVRKITPIPLQDNADQIEVNEPPLKLFQKIYDENDAFLKLKYFLDIDCFNFVRELVAVSRSVIKTSKQEDDIKLLVNKQSMSVIQYVQLTQQWVSKDASSQTDLNSFTALFNQIKSASNYVDQVDQQFSTHVGFKTLQFACLFAFDMILKVKDGQSFLQWMSLIELMIKDQPMVCLWLVKYLTANNKILEEILLVNQNGDIREQFANLIKTSLACLRKSEVHEEQYCDTYLEFPSLKTVTVPKSAVQRFFVLMCGVLDTKVRQNWRRYDEFFSVMSEHITEGGIYSSKIFVTQNLMIQRLVRFINNQSYKNEAGELVKKMEINLTEPNFSRPLNLLSLLIRGLYTYGIEGQKLYAPTSLYQSEKDHLLLPSLEASMLLQKDFIIDLINKTSQETESLVQIYVHLSWGDLNVSLFLEKLLIDEIKKQKDPETALALLDGLMRLEDSLAIDRLDFIFDFGKRYLESTPLMNYLMVCQNQKFIFTVLQTVINCDCEHVRSFLLTNSERYKEWLDGYFSTATFVEPTQRAMFREVQQKWKNLVGLTVQEQEFADAMNTSFNGLINDEQFVNSEGASNKGQPDEDQNHDDYTPLDNQFFGFDNEINMNEDFYDFDN